MKFTDLFKFKKKEINQTFQNITYQDKIEGLKLLQGTKNANKHGKLLIITSKKVGKAYKRNKIRRQLKSIFYQEQLYKNPINTIIIVYRTALNLTFEELKKFLIKNIKITDE